MKNKTILVIVSALLVSMIVFSCKKDQEPDTNDDTFCEFVSSRNFEASGPIINEFFANLGQDSQENNLNTLKNWLEVKKLCGLSNHPFQLMYIHKSSAKRSKGDFYFERATHHSDDGHHHVRPATIQDLPR